MRPLWTSLALLLASLLHVEGYTCPSGKSKETITLAVGESVDFSTQDTETYGKNVKCVVKFKRGKRSKCKLNFSCSAFTLTAKNSNCNKGSDFVKIGKEKFCEDNSPDVTVNGRTLNVLFRSNKRSKGGEGAECTATCIDNEEVSTTTPAASTEAPTTTPSPATTAAPTTGACPEFCIEIFQPVCGSNGETYSNECYLQMAACTSTTPISQAYEGECAECPAEQPEFGDACSLPEAAQCPYGEECCCGQCHPNMMMMCGGGSWQGYATEACMRPDCGNTTTGCPEFCPAIYDPVCGSDGNTYSNVCQFEIALCNSATPISVVSQGECGSGAMEDQTIAWVRGMTPVEICVTPGTTVTFDWTSGHNMLEVTSDSFWSCTGLSNTSPEAGPATWIAPSVLGMNYFACGVPGHCSNGMKALVEVKAVCPA